MSHIFINIDDETKKKLKVFCATNNTTITRLISDFIQGIVVCHKTKKEPKKG